MGVRACSLVSLPLAMVPGLGHLVLGRSRRGLAFFAGASAAFNLAWLSWIVPVGPLNTWTLRLGLAASLALVLYSLLDVYRIAIHPLWPRGRRRRTELLRRGIRALRAGRIQEARASLEGVLDLDGADPAARLYLARVERRAGQPERAAWHARSELRSFPSNPHRAKLARELELAREAIRGR